VQYVKANMFVKISGGGDNCPVCPFLVAALPQGDAAKSVHRVFHQDLTVIRFTLAKYGNTV